MKIWGLALAGMLALTASQGFCQDTTRARPLDRAMSQYLDRFPSALRDFGSPDWSVKYRALERLVAGGAVSVPVLVEGLRLDCDAQKPPMRGPAFLPEVGRHCAIALGRIGDRGAGPSLMNALTHPDRDTRREIIRALGKVRCEEAIPALLGLWADPQEDKTNKREAALALVRMGGKAARPVAEAVIKREQERLAIVTLLKIALVDLGAVRAVADSPENAAAKKRAEAALAELQRRRQGTREVPPLPELERKASVLLKESKVAEAVALWEQVIDCGLYSQDDEESARDRVLSLKTQIGTKLVPAPETTWRNKVYVIKNYDADLLDKDGKVVRHVRYSLSPEEIENVRKRFAGITQCIWEGSCGAFRMVNDIEVVETPWRTFRPSIKSHEPGAVRYQVPRTDLNAVFDFQKDFLQRGYGCVLFQLRSDGETFGMDGGAAAGRGVVNGQNERYDSADFTAACHEWLHILHGTISKNGKFDWAQYIPLHDQLRDMRLRVSWMTGRICPQQDVFVDCMRRYLTTSMWRAAVAEKVTDLEKEE